MSRLSSLMTIMVGVGVIIVIINDPWSPWQVGHHQINIDWGHRCRRHQLWSLSLLASTVVIVVIGRGPRHHQHCLRSLLSSTLTVVVVGRGLRQRSWRVGRLSSSRCHHWQRSCACEHHRCRQRQALSSFAIVSSAIQGEGSGLWLCGGCHLQIGTRGSSKQSRSSVQSWV